MKIIKDYLIIKNIFELKLNVFMNSSLDDEGRERFHVLNVKAHLLGNFPKWLFNYAKNPVIKVIQI